MKLEIPSITLEELMDLRSSLFKALAQYDQIHPVEGRHLSLGQMALMTGEPKISVRSVLESLQQDRFIAIDKRRITLNKTERK